MLATAFEVLHFRRFLEESGPLTESLMSKLTQLKEEPSPTLMQSIETSDDYQEVMAKYRGYTKCTLSGDHGNTARFWILYVSLVHVFLRFSHACRTNDLELFIYTLGQMLPIFFAGNRPNYSRWMVRYYLNLLNVDESHPGVREMLEKGAFSVKRTAKPFSRAAIDMTLEQTVNRDAASRLTGIAAFGQSEAARKRWMMTRSVRSSIVNNLMNKAGLQSNEDITKELKPYRIKKDNEDLQKIIEGIKSTMNPFTQYPNENLYCLATGKKADEEIKDDLLNCVKKGQAWCDDFTNGCFQDPSRFQKPIPRKKVKNFVTTAIKSKVGSKDVKIKELQGTRDLFARLLYLNGEY